MRHYLVLFLLVNAFVALLLWAGIDKTKPFIAIDETTYFDNTFQSDASDIRLMRVKNQHRVSHYLYVMPGKEVQIEGIGYLEGTHEIFFEDLKGYLTLSYQEDPIEQTYLFYYSNEATDYLQVTWRHINPYKDYGSTLLLFSLISLIVFAIHALIKAKTAYPKTPLKGRKIQKAELAGLILLGGFYLVIPFVLYAIFIIYVTGFLLTHINKWRNKVASLAIFLGLVLVSLGLYLGGIYYFIEESPMEYVEPSTPLFGQMHKEYKTIIHDVAYYSPLLPVFHEDEQFTFFLVEGYATFSYSSDGKTLRPELYFVYYSLNYPSVFLEIHTETGRFHTLNLMPNSRTVYLFDDWINGPFTLHIRQQSDLTLLFESSPFSIASSPQAARDLFKGGQYLANEAGHFARILMISHSVNLVFMGGLWVFKKRILKHARKPLSMASLYYDQII